MRKRNIEIKFRLSEKEHEELKQKIAQSCMTRNAFLVRMVKQQTIYPVNSLNELNMKVDALLTQIRGMGTNLNQIAKIANSRRDVPALSYLAYLQTVLQSVKNEIQPVFTALREVLYGNR